MDHLNVLQCMQPYISLEDLLNCAQLCKAAFTTFSPVVSSKKKRGKKGKERGRERAEKNVEYRFEVTSTDKCQFFVHFQSYRIQNVCSPKTRAIDWFGCTPFYHHSHHYRALQHLSPHTIAWSPHFVAFVAWRKILIKTDNGPPAKQASIITLK